MIISPSTEPLKTESNFMLRVWIDETFEVDASREQVFAKMADIRGWTRWVPGLAAIWRAKPGVGNTFFMVLAFPVLQRVVLPCTITRWSADTLEWGGGGAGSIVRHRFELTALSPTRTRVRHVEYATGLLGLFFRPFEAFAYRHDHTWNQALLRELANAQPIPHSEIYA